MTRHPGLLATLIALLVFAPPAGAEVVRIRSGEHDGFSRLVLTLKDPVENWQFGRMDDGYQLRLGARDVEFDLGQVFDKIPRSRLAAISADDAAGRLTLRLGCPCHAEIFPFRPNVLVIDIRPGPAPRNSPFEKPLAAATPPAPAPAPTPAYDWRKIELAPPPLPTTPIPPTPAPPDPAVAKAREQLLRQLARAGAQGLIKADPHKLGLPRKDGTSSAGGSAPPPEAQSHDPSTPQADIGLRSRTAMDRDAPETPDPGLTENGGACPPDSDFNLPAWADDKPPGEQIGTLRRGLLGEFDHPNRGAVAKLARLYLNLGFGAEARMVLRAFPDQAGDERARIRALAAIIDGDRPDLSRPLAGLAACDGAVALWSVLATPAPTPTDPIAANAVLRNFSGLPLRVRRHLGPHLAEVFLARGDTSTARALRDAIARAVRTPGDSVNLLNARLDMAEGRPAAAEASLAPVIADDGPRSPEALALMIDNRVTQGHPVDAATIEAVAALAHEYRNTPFGKTLRRAHALALASAGRFTEAFATIGPGTSGDRLLWSLLATRGSDEALLANALTPPEGQADPATRLKIADRLIELGFATAAQAWLPPPSQADPAERLTLARAALELRDGQVALRRLAGLDGPAAALLRARAYALLGDHDKAAQIYATLGATDLEGAQAWRAGDWAKARKTGSPAQKNALDIVPGATPDTPRPEGPLARDRALIGQSEAARKALSTLLGDTPLPAIEAQTQAPTH